MINDEIFYLKHELARAEMQISLLEGHLKTFQERKPVSAYVIKSALSRGIFKVNGVVGARSALDINTLEWIEGKHVRYAVDGEWFLSPDDAIKRANEIRDEKIESLRVEIAKLEAIEFKCTG
jgi:hypothetical protein